MVNEGHAPRRKLRRKADRSRLIERLAISAAILLWCGSALVAHHQASRIHSLQMQNQARIADIQRQRIDSILSSCRETNARYDGTIGALGTLLTQAKKDHPERAAQIEESRASTILLIRALVPKQNCELRAKKLAPPNRLRGTG